MTYVRTRLALDRMQPGQTLAVRLRGEDPARNVPASALRQGHTLISQATEPDGATLLLLRRGASPVRTVAPGPQSTPLRPDTASLRRSVSASEPSA